MSLQIQGVLLFGLNQSTPKSGMSKKSNYRQLLCYIEVHKIIRVKLWQTAFSTKTCIQLVCLHGEYCALSSGDPERDGGSIQIARPVCEQLFSRTVVLMNSCSREQLLPDHMTAQ